MDITKPDNPADVVIKLEVSGNKLVSVLNSLQQLMHETGRTQFAKDGGYLFSSPWYEELHETVERIRDQLSDQRCAARNLGSE